MGNFTATFLGRSDAERLALLGLIESEDEVFKLQPGEEDSPKVHARADIPRFRLLNARAKLQQAISDRKSDRNMYMTITVGAILFIKTGVTWGDIGHFIGTFFH